MTVLLELFLSFVKVGFTSFGGLSMVPVISGEMLSHGWMTETEVADIIVIAEMTPGPLGLNCASFAGMRAAGLAGAICANLGVMFPSFSLCLLAAIFYERFKKSRLMESVLTGVRPACVGMMFGLAVTMFSSGYMPGGKVSLPSLGLGIADFILLQKFKVSVPLIIGINAVLGLLLFGVAGL